MSNNNIVGAGTNTNNTSLNYSFENYMSDSLKFLDKIHQHPFLWKYSQNHVYYPNPEYLNTDVSQIAPNTTVYLIMFVIDNNCVYPFVKFAMTSDNELVKNAGPMFFQVNDDFDIDCNKALLNSFNKPDNTISDYFDVNFKGFLNLDDSVFAFYDIAPLLQQGFKLKDNFKFLLSSEVCESANKGLQKINKNTDYPKCVFYQPVYLIKPSTLDNTVKTELIPLPVVAYCKTDKPLLTDLDKDNGFYYVFTERFIGPVKNHVRYALFLMNHKPWFSLEDNVNTFTFVENGVLHFAVKSPDQFIAL